MKKLTALILCLMMLLCSCAHAEAEECEHLDFYIINELNDGVYTPVNEDLHHVSGLMTEVKVCIDCDEEIPGEEYEVDEEEYHSYYDGVCMDCGQTCEHERSYTYEEHRDLEYTPLDEWNHTITCDIYESTSCEVCGYQLEEKLLNGGYSFEDVHYFDGGFCIDCGAENTCAHENTETTDSFEYHDILPKDEKEHTSVGNLYASTYCMDCGEQISYELVEEGHERDEEHWFAEGMCYQCGTENTCKHENTEVWENLATVSSSQKDDFFHTLISEQYNVYRCLDCGEDFSSELVNDQYTSEAEHWFWEGECLECGYTDQLDERVRLVGGVVIGLNTLASFAESSGASAWLLYPQAILTEEEQISFNDLVFSENWLSAQALTILTAIGYDDAVQEALNGGLITLTESESALITAVSERIAAMDAAELASFEQTLDEFFPVERVTDDGKAMRTLSLTVSSPENGGAMTEVYTLLYNEDFSEWSFEMTEAG